MDHDKELADLDEWTAAVKANEDAQTFNVAGRDAQIRWLLANGVGATELARRTGLARSRIYQIDSKPERK